MPDSKTGIPATPAPAKAATPMPTAPAGRVAPQPSLELPAHPVVLDQHKVSLRLSPAMKALLLAVLLPTFLSVIYFGLWASPMYIAEARFAVRGADGETYYTRAGSFVWAVGANGALTLATSDGYPVLGTNGNPITLPANVTPDSVVVGSDGSLGYVTAEGTYTDMNQSFALYQFNNPGGLEKVGDNLLAESAASGVAMNEATTQGLIPSQIRQKYLEGSNVQVADEMVNMIIAQRAYQLNSKAITTSDEMLEQANNLKR